MIVGILLACDVFAQSPTCNNTDIGNGWTCVAVAGNHLGGNGGTSTPINTTNAGSSNLLLIAIVAHELNNPMCQPTDNYGNTYLPLIKTSSQGQTLAVRFFYKINGMVGPAHTITCTGTDTFPASIFTAFSGARPDQGTIVENGFAPNNTVSTIQPGSITPTQPNALVVTLVGTSVLQNAAHMIDSGFSEPIDVPGAAVPGFGGNIGAGIGFLTMGAAAAVNPKWSWAGGTDIPAARIAVFNNANNVLPALSFSAQPSSTVSGQTMASVGVTATPSTFTGTVTLAIQNCAGVSATNMTAELASGQAMFPNMVFSGTGTGCSLTATAPGAASATSGSFEVTAPNAVPFLSFTHQPDNTVNGATFQPAIAGTKNVP